MKIRALVVKVLLAILNSRWLNQSPCKYEFVGNIDAFSREDIESSLRQEPGMTLRAYLDVADRFKACPISRIGITVIEPDGTYSQNRGM
jgi:hypothetical protein